jgi:hypothetical protein
MDDVTASDSPLDQGPSDQVTDEREGILDACVEFAQQILAEHGEFYPFGVSLRSDGLTMDEVYGDEDDEDVPEIEEIVQRIVETHRAAAASGELIACGTTLDVEVTDPDGQERDAICVDVEHRDAEPVRCLLPYEIGDDGEISYGELLALRLDGEIFPAEGDTGAP